MKERKESKFEVAAGLLNGGVRVEWQRERKREYLAPENPAGDLLLLLPLLLR